MSKPITIGLDAWWPDMADGHREWRKAVIGTAAVRLHSFISWQYIAANGTANFSRMLNLNWWAGARICTLWPGNFESASERLALTSDADFTARFVDYCVRMHEAADGHVSAWEIFNEPVPGRFWMPFWVNTYGAMFDWLVEVTAAVRTALPQDAALYGPGYSNVFYGGELSGLIAAGYLPLVDAWNVHDYNLSNGDPALPWATHPSLLDRYKIVRSQIGAKPIVLSEVGLYRAATPEQHTLLAGTQRECGVELVILHQGDLMGPDPSGFNDDGSPRAGLVSYLAAASGPELAATTAVEPAAPSDCFPGAVPRVTITVDELDGIKGIGPTLAGRAKLALDNWDYSRPAN